MTALLPVSSHDSSLRMMPDALLISTFSSPSKPLPQLDSATASTYPAKLSILPYPCMAI
jgi:hypothetical protein